MNNIRRVKYLLMGVLLAMPCSLANGESSSLPPGGAISAPPEVHKKGEIVQIKQILDDLAAFKNKDVMLEGTFHGWKGKCSSSLMLTRSDWILEDETGCIYITGRMPDNLSPMKPRGERIMVTGRVQVTKKGKPVIKARQLTLVPKIE